MMKTIPFSGRTCLWILLLITSIIACKGPDGDVGPAGAQGPQGVPGPNGAQGPAGPAGAANVIVSPWVKVSHTAWQREDSTYFMVTHPDTRITQAILDSALVMAYYRNDGRPNVVFSLPSANEELTLGFFMQVQNQTGTINFDVTYYKPRLTPIDFDLEFRWIIIPSDKKGRIAIADLKNYAFVKQQLGLTD
ncbi:MAG: collagen-like protein [Dyadobacter sp.]|uniref:collagen-like triple helix repeat-containing protein n=1 Tax=Dyadobacter sp. TaxID=1914288 RepID=UPI001B102897|nr:collagen-like protein [Dyadobacter sp.]MBO9611086.1 collagen-like protein [Dyadobacter sp.]